MDVNSIAQMLPDAPQVLYKYRRWDKLVNEDDFHRNILTKKELYYSSPDELNDPYDINIKLNFNALSMDKRVHYYFNILKKNPNNYLRFSKNNSSLSYESQLYEDIWINRKMLTDDFMSKMAQQQILMIRDATKIFCLSESETTNRMWSSYSNSHTGYCIGFKTANLFFKGCGMIPKVNYYKEMPDIIPTDNFNNNADILIQMTYKNIEWENEMEYRFIKIDKKDRIINFSSEDVAEIVLGYKMQAKQKEEIIDLCKKEFPNVPICQIEMDPRKYFLNKARIK